VLDLRVTLEAERDIDAIPVAQERESVKAMIDSLENNALSHPFIRLAPEDSYAVFCGRWMITYKIIEVTDSVVVCSVTEYPPSNAAT
jgi:hypothetical protein